MGKASDVSMIKRVFLLFLLINLSFNTYSQELHLYGYLAKEDIKSVENTCTELFRILNGKRINIFFNDQPILTLRKKDRGYEYLIKAAITRLNILSNLECNEIEEKIINVSAKYKHKKEVFTYAKSDCGDIAKYNLNEVISNIEKGRYSRSNVVIALFFNRPKPRLNVITPSSNSILAYKFISGTLEDTYPSKIHIILNQSEKYVIDGQQNWSVSLSTETRVNQVQIFSVNNMNDSSEIVVIGNLKSKELDERSIRMIHPGGDTNGKYSDVVKKCNTSTFNGFFNFRIALEKGLPLDSVSLIIEDSKQGKITKLKRLYNLDPSLIRKVEGEYFDEYCLFLVFSEFGFSSPCEIDNKFLYYLNFRSPSGRIINTKKKVIFFESFRENYDESPCNCY